MGTKSNFVTLADIQPHDDFDGEDFHKPKVEVMDPEIYEQLREILPELAQAPAGKIFKTNIRKVIVEGINYTDEMRNDFIRGKGVIISNPEAFDKKNNKNPDGLQSEFFGSDYGDNAAFDDRWSCQCGKYIGRMYHDRICDECGTPIEFSETDLEKFGWIVLDRYQIMQPLYFQKLEIALGTLEGTSESVLQGIITVEYRDKRQPIHMNDEKFKLLLSKHPFLRKGMIWLSEHIVEVLDYYSVKRGPKKKAQFDELYNNLDKLFCHAIPAYNSALRLETPGVKGEKFFKTKVNSYFGSIIKTFNKINNYYTENPSYTDEIEINKFLKAAQNELIQIWDEEFSIISGKKGLIQAKVIAGRVNYSARLIIKAGSGILHADEVDLPYIVMLDLFNNELMSLYRQLERCSLKRAQIKWEEAHIHFDKKFYAMMLWLIHDRSNLPYIHIMIDRNPSINFGSFLTVKIAHINPNITDKTMTLNTRVIKTMNADFDGDQLNVFRIIGADLGSRFDRNMNPKYNLYISKTNGRVNPAMMPAKNETVGFFQFNNYGISSPSLDQIRKAGGHFKFDIEEVYSEQPPSNRRNI